VLARKPGALPGSTALAQARAAGSFTPAHDAFWAAARKSVGDGVGTRALIEVLLLHRHLPAAAVQAGLTAALTVGSCNPDMVAVEARKACVDPAAAAPALAPTEDQQVISLTERRLTTHRDLSAELPADTREVPSVIAYDELLSSGRRSS
jgi:hypothetical protein